jgi:hypothetical protein
MGIKRKEDVDNEMKRTRIVKERRTSRRRIAEVIRIINSKRKEEDS